MRTRLHLPECAKYVMGRDARETMNPETRIGGGRAEKVKRGGECLEIRPRFRSSKGQARFRELPRRVYLAIAAFVQIAYRLFTHRRGRAKIRERIRVSDRSDRCSVSGSTGTFADGVPRSSANSSAAGFFGNSESPHLRNIFYPFYFLLESAWNSRNRPPATRTPIEEAAFTVARRDLSVTSARKIRSSISSVSRHRLKPIEIYHRRWQEA